MNVKIHFLLYISLGLALHSTYSMAGEAEFSAVQSKAEQGDAAAQFDLGWKYQAGTEVPQDFVESAKWLRKAAEQENAQAQNKLGFMYYNGQGVARDFVEAAKWFRKAADHGITSAQDMLGRMYQDSKGVKRDYVQAYMWVLLATSQQEASKRTLRELEPFMTQEQIAEARKRASLWRPVSKGYYRNSKAN